LSTLNLSDPAPLSAYQPQPPEKPKNAALAFVLSLVLPGAGQLYAKRETAGSVTLLFFVGAVGLSATLLAQPPNPLGYTGLGVAVPLYIFAFLDAYFSALEYNAGLSSFMIGGNPRIAAILNFLTNGIGYFYLGERGKGLAMFLGLGIFVHGLLSRVFPNSGVVILLWLALQSFLAYDAYRIARRQLVSSFPEMEGHSWKAAATGQMGPVLPVALALILCIPLTGLVSIGVFAKGAAGIAGGETVVVPEGVKYLNATYGLSVTLPDHWTAEAKNGALSATNGEGDCRILLLREFMLLSPQHYQRNIDAQLSKKVGFSIYDHRESTLDGRAAAAMTVSIGSSVTEQMITARTGLTVYSLILTARGEPEGCSRPRGHRA